MRAAAPEALRPGRPDGAPHAAAIARCAAVACVLLAARAAAAQGPAPIPAAQAPAAAPPLVQIKDDKQLAERLHVITQDPAIAVDDPANRPLAQALMLEGIKQLRARAYDQALANFLEAYARFPSPRLLLSVAAVLRDMGRIADVANTYQRYLADPGNGGERVAEITELLSQLDEQLTTLDIQVMPRSSDISIDGGPFVEVASSLVTRVRAGLHVVRIRKGALTNELAVTGVEGETKKVASELQVERPAGSRPPAAGPGAAPANRVDGWLLTGTHYGAESATSPARKVRASSDGREVAAIIPPHDLVDHSGATDGEPDGGFSYGAIAVVRIDGQGRGGAGGFGAVIGRGALQTEIMVLASDKLGGYLGLRYRLLSGSVRPYAAVGVPGFAFNHDELQPDATTSTTRRLAVGIRGAAGVEWAISDHLSVHGDLGYEHFFFLDEHFEADLFVPTLGVIGRL